MLNFRRNQKTHFVSKLNKGLSRTPSIVRNAVDEAANTALAATLGQKPDLTTLAGNILRDEVSDSADLIAKHLTQSNQIPSIGKSSNPTHFADHGRAYHTNSHYTPDTVHQHDGIEDLYDAYQSGLQSDVNEMAAANFATAMSVTAITRSSTAGFFSDTVRGISNVGKFTYGLEAGIAKGAEKLVYSTADAFDHPTQTVLSILAAGQALDHASMHFMHELLNPKTRPEAYLQVKNVSKYVGLALTTKLHELSRLGPEAMGDAIGENAVDAGSYLIPGEGEVHGITATSTAMHDIRAIAAVHVREAKNLLRNAGVPIADRNEILRSFDLETLRVTHLQAFQKEYRVFDDFDANLRGRYVTPNVNPSQTDRIVNLALPNNSATRLAEVFLPEGSTIITGRIASQLNFSQGLIGGGKQSFLLGSLDLYDFKEIMMPRKILNTEEFQP